MDEIKFTSLLGLLNKNEELQLILDFDRFLILIKSNKIMTIII